LQKRNKTRIKNYEKIVKNKKPKRKICDFFIKTKDCIFASKL